ncbi:Putative periplasmic protein [hydrothermal vent metagenome]|uniref:Periplasmic protein n=1 Tax=hydrothermal vent metagenome TaxID=652676 RepID=A0A3B1CIQ7_9ZZZZ
MNGFGYQKKKGSRIKKLAVILLLPFIILVLSYTAYKLFLIPPPVVEGIDAFSLLPADKTITIHGKNLKSIDVSVTQDLKSVELLQDEPAGMEKTYILQIKPKALGLRDGPAVITVKAKSGILKKVEYKIDALIDTVAPKLRVVNAPSVVYKGMGTVALLWAEGADSVFIRIDDGEPFKAYKTSDGADSDYVVFFPVPFDIKDKAVFYAVARDHAGNQTVRTLPAKVKKKTFRRSSIRISDDFINRVVYPLFNESKLPDPVSAFLKVNGEWRDRDVKRLGAIGRKSEPRMLWKGRFLQLRNSKVMAAYGDRREYLYKGKPISRSVHLGYDLASVSNARVKAANSGIVRFAGDLGIYGNTVIIDHGLGLMSLYGHLSEILVKEGQSVKKGELIARTGSTGLAGGDHLHFGILVQGIEVSPLYWWDPRWIKANVGFIDSVALKGIRKNR